MDSRQATIKSVKMEGTSVQIGVSVKGLRYGPCVESVESEDPRLPDSYASGKTSADAVRADQLQDRRSLAGGPGGREAAFSEAAPFRSNGTNMIPSPTGGTIFGLCKICSRPQICHADPARWGIGDADGVANGVIVDPAGVVEEADAETTSSSSGGGGAGASSQPPLPRQMPPTPRLTGGGRWEC